MLSKIGKLGGRQIKQLNYSNGRSFMSVDSVKRGINSRINNKQIENASLLAEYLESHSEIEKVYLPETNNDGIVAFEMKGGFKTGVRVINNTELCTIAENLEDSETLIQHPASMYYSSYTKEELGTIGISEGLITVSVGIENIDDIIDDLEEAIEMATQKLRDIIVYQIKKTPDNQLKGTKHVISTQEDWNSIEF